MPSSQASRDFAKKKKAVAYRAGTPRSPRPFNYYNDNLFRMDFFMVNELQLPVFQFQCASRVRIKIRPLMKSRVHGAEQSITVASVP